MKKRLLFIFILIILMPVTVMTVTAFNSFREGERRELERQKEEAGALLLESARLLQNSITLLEGELDMALPDPSRSPDDLRAAVKGMSLIRQVFIIDKSGRFLFPDPEGEISGRERDFLAEAARIDLAAGLKAGFRQSEEGTEIRRWYTWFMGDGINFIVYSMEEGEIRGYLLERYALLSRLINVLPDSASGERSFRIELTDARGEILYQWGAYSRGETDSPLREYSLREPLGSWRLFFYQNPEAGAVSRNNPFSMIPLSGFLTLMLILMAVYFYRESSREMRIAQNQVTFVSQVTHELKTPLTNIRLYSELLQEKLTDPGLRNYADVIVSEGGRLGRMINNVLTFSRGERGELKKNPEPVEVNELILEVLKKFDPLLKEKEMEQELKGPAFPVIETDRDMLEQILINLIGNAVKYASSGRYLGVHREIRDDSGRILITDRGPGIPAREREKIFKPFYRIDNSLSQTSSGTGIGLSIARTLARESGFRLELEKSDTGACFSLTIPLKRQEGNHL